MVKKLGLLKVIAVTGAVSVALTTYINAGPRAGADRAYTGQSGANSGSRFGQRNDPGTLNNQPTDSSSNPGFDRQRDRDSDGSDFGRTRATDGASDATNTSESEQSAPAQAGSNGSGQRNSDSNFIHRANDERVVETHDAKSKDSENERAQHQTERSEVSKKFDSSLLLADVAGVPGGANAAGPTKNPGLDHMSQQGLQSSESGRTTAQNSIDQQRAQNHIPPGHHYGWKQRENNPHNPLSDRERLNERERERVRRFLREHLTEQQRDRLEGILQDGLTPTEREELRDFFKERLTPKQWEVLKAFLNHKIQESD